MPAEPAEIIRPSTPADVPALSALFAEVFGQERSAAVWMWKLFENPRGSVSFVCEADNRLVAHCAGLPVRFRDYHREYPALQSVDFMSSPRYAGGLGKGGVFIRTAERFFHACCGPTAVPLVYGFPGERHRMLGEKLLGYRSVERVAELTLEPADGASEQIEPLRQEHLRYFNALPVEFGAIRDEPYLQWRYLQHPLHRYGFLQVRRPLRMHSRIAAILRITEEAVFIMELGGDFSRSSIASLISVLQRLERPVRFWCSPQHPIARLLLSSGFRAELRPHFVECRFFIQHEIPQPGELYYTLGDYDVH